MEITRQDNDEGSIVKVSGRLDLRISDELKKKVIEALVESDGYLVIDLSRADFIDSAALGALIAAQRETHKMDGKLAIVSPNGPAKHIFTNTRTDRFFSLCESLEDAQAEITS